MEHRRGAARRMLCLLQARAAIRASGFDLNPEA
jgi:hypothetical protein